MKGRSSSAMAAALLTAACASSRPAPSGLAANAEALRRTDQTAAAYPLWANLVCEEPDTALWVVRLVEAWSLLGQPSHPRERLECRVGVGSEALITALVAAARGDVATAESAFATAERTFPGGQRAEVLLRRGLTLLRNGEPGAAVVALDRAAGLAPERVDVRLALVEGLVETDAFERAVETLRSSLRLAPSASDLARGKALLRQGLRRAEPSLPEPVRQQLDDALVASERGELTGDALAQLFSIADETAHPRALTVAGVLGLRRGANEEGTRMLRMAAELAPWDPEPVRALASALFSGGQHVEALPLLREVTRRDPLDAAATLMMALAMRELGDGNGACDAYAALVVFEPGNLDHRLWQARLERQRGRSEVAARVLAEGLAMDPRHVGLLVEHAVVRVQLAREARGGARADAGRSARQAVAALLSSSPDHPAGVTLTASLDAIDE